jgi:hypothetical protein
VADAGGPAVLPGRFSLAEKRPFFGTTRPKLLAHLRIAH